MMAIQLARHFDHLAIAELLAAAMARQELLEERLTARSKKLQE